MNGTSTTTVNAQTMATGQNAKFTTALNCHQSDLSSSNCIVSDATVSRHDSTITSNLTTINSTHNDSPIISPSSSTNIKKKSSSFLHRDYNRKPILARSQVSKSWLLEKFTPTSRSLILSLSCLLTYLLSAYNHCMANEGENEKRKSLQRVMVVVVVIFQAYLFSFIYFCSVTTLDGNFLSALVPFLFIFFSARPIH